VVTVVRWAETEVEMEAEEMEGRACKCPT
jgi:hypothetical protein